MPDASGPVLDQCNIVVKDMAAMVEFDERLGCPIVGWTDCGIDTTAPCRAAADSTSISTAKRSRRAVELGSSAWERPVR